MSCDNCSFPYSLCQCPEVVAARKAAPEPVYLGNFSSAPYCNIPFVCADCNVSWGGCAAAADCPHCGAQFDWNDPSKPPVKPGEQHGSNTVSG